MGNYKISVIVPVYNADKYLNKCVDSIIDQTLKNIEIILVDDGSTDSSSTICDEYQRKYENIRVLHIKNSGPSKARNIGLEIAQGEYIGFVDADDWCATDQFEKLYNNAIDNNSDISMCSFYVTDGKKDKSINIELLPLYKTKDEIKENLLSQFYKEHLLGMNSLWIKIFRRSTLIDNNIKMDENLLRAEDMWFIFDALKVSNTFSFIAQPLYYYYQNESSIMHDSKNDSYEHWVNNRKRLLNENEILKLEIDYNLFYKDFIFKAVLFCRDKVKLNQINIAKAVLKDEFFINAIKYADLLPVHVKLICKFAQLKLTNLAIIMLKIW